MRLDPNLTLQINDQLYLKAPQTKDASDLFQLVQNNRSYLRTFLAWVDHNKSLNDAHKWIQESRAAIKKNERFPLLIWHHQQIVGCVDFISIDKENQAASIGYWLDESSQGKGIMTQSMQAFIEYGFTQLKLHRIEIRCAVENKKSEQIAIRLGFKKEGILKEVEFLYGKYLDHHLYAMIAP